MMRRIYESSALDRDDDDPFRPNESDVRSEPRAARTIPAATLSRALVPKWLRHRAISISVSTPQTVYEQGSTIPFSVTMKNAMPFPVSIPTRSPILWTWSVNGIREASHVAENPENPPDDPRELTFDRGEWKAFDRSWNQLFRVSDAEWEAAEPGEHTIGAAINVDDPAAKGVADETTIRID